MKKSFTPLEDFEWPVYKNENERIKLNTRKYHGLSISEAFAKEYGVSVCGDENSSFNSYSDVQVGDEIPLKIQSITRKGVVFDNACYKDEIVSNVNLYQYEMLRKFLPVDAIRCLVIGKEKGKIIVDPLQCMLRDWLTKHVEKRSEQYCLNNDVKMFGRCVKVENLRRISSGYLGRVKVDTISGFVGQPVYIEAFIPGSHIVLNIENNFDRWEGQTVDAFVTNYIHKPGSANDMSLICSRKNMLTFLGQKNLINWFKHYTEEDAMWKDLVTSRMNGTITGVINSSKKCGVFVEIPEFNITGMVMVPPEELTKYHKGESIDVHISKFDEVLKYNPAVGQMQHELPYRFHLAEDGEQILDEFHLKPVFTLA